jgi:hypothetical protein
MMATTLPLDFKPLFCSQFFTQLTSSVFFSPDYNRWYGLYYVNTIIIYTRVWRDIPGHRLLKAVWQGADCTIFLHDLSWVYMPIFRAIGLFSLWHRIKNWGRRKTRPLFTGGWRTRLTLTSIPNFSRSESLSLYLETVCAYMNACECHLPHLSVRAGDPHTHSM